MDEKKFAVSWKSKHFDATAATEFDNEPIGGFEIPDLTKTAAENKAAQLRNSGDAYGVEVEEQ